MEENSPLWLALREAGRRVLSLGEISIEIPIKHHDRWHRLILNMSDALPQRITFPHISTGENLVVKDTNGRMILTNQEPPSSMETLWLPLKTDIGLPAVEQMCSELLLAGYPGCEGCGFRENEDEWDEEMSRNNLDAFLE
ncbi:hypothetical protein N9L38_02595 [Candidatus Poseidoniales archaeon]|nr:hypothetical protein [Candidatus Poseidoniales archaeon]MDA8777770.1 hypothetical protein [Candidatus Poseidoniales archaeon]